jgi:hypothetical protein
MEVLKVNKNDNYNNFDYFDNKYNFDPLFYKLTNCTDCLEIFTTDDKMEFFKYVHELYVSFDEILLFQGNTKNLPKKYQNVFFKSILLHEEALPVFCVSSLNLLLYEIEIPIFKHSGYI